ncbi:MAG TPA: Crp/Fnr family transcriptional regulator [Pyrinomonadaceae bacterium]|nr:Crp/Fnr family transcriptional regulator [Pyrinomonadaceae bacterium]
MRSAANLEINQNTSALRMPRPTHALSDFENAKLSTIHPRGTFLFSEGQPAQGVYLVVAGTVKVSISSAQGRVLILRIAQPGDLLGIKSTLFGFPYEATAETLRQCRTVFIPQAEFIALHNQDERLREAVLRALGSYLSSLIEATRRLMLSETAAEKLARLLLKWCDDHGVIEPHGIRVRNEFTQEEIANMICASRETVTRLLGEFSKNGLIQLTSNTVFVSDRRGLESIGAI